MPSHILPEIRVTPVLIWFIYAHFAKIVSVKFIHATIVLLTIVKPLGYISNATELIFTDFCILFCGTILDRRQLSRRHYSWQHLSWWSLLKKYLKFQLMFWDLKLWTQLVLLVAVIAVCLLLFGNKLQKIRLFGTRRLGEVTDHWSNICSVTS